MGNSKPPAKPIDPSSSSEGGEITNPAPKVIAHTILWNDVLNQINTQLIGTLRVGVVVYDQDLKHILWNPFMQTLTGLRQEEVLGRRPSELFPFLNEQGFDQLIEKALAGEPGSTGDFAYYVPATGKSGWAIAEYAPLRDSNNRVQGVIATVEDITRRKLAEQALDQSEQRYQNVVETATDVIYMLSMDGIIISLNQAFESLTGWSRSDCIGRSFLGLIHPDDARIASEFLQSVLVGRESGAFELRFLSKSGEYLIGECTAAPQVEHGKITAICGIVRDVTARKRSEEALRLAEEEYRSIFENALDGMFRSAPDGKFLLVNPALAELLGYESAEDLIESAGVVGSQFYADPQRRAEYEQMMRDQGFVERFENLARRRDGQIISISESGRAVLSANGELLYYEGTIRDITERKGAAEALRHSEEKYRELVENINDIVYAADDHGTISYVNPVVEVITGYSPLEMIGKSLVEFVYFEDLSLFRESLGQTIAGKIEPLEYRIVAKSGEVRWVRSSSREAFDGDRAVGLRGIIADITAHKRVEAHLERLATAVEQASESIVITDAEGTIQYVNPAYERTTGYSREEVTGNKPWLPWSAGQDQSGYHEMKRAMTRGEGWTGRFINQRKDGRCFEEEATISPVRDRSGRIVNFVAVNRDVTKEVELEKQLLHAQKMEAVGRLAGGVAHDFNNLLTAIIGYGQLLERQMGVNHPLLAEIKEILDAGNRAAALTTQLLAFSRRQTLVPRNIDLTETIANLMKMLQRIIGEDVDLSFETAPNIHPIFADEGQIEQVIMNLAVNARDAMPAGGRLIIETHNVMLDEAYCRDHVWARPGEYARISVSDTGVGMDSETLRRIFEPFFTTKETGKGTGLGLAVVYGIVKQHDGLIHVYSEPDHGTTFKLYFKAQTSTPAGEAPEAPGELRGGHETILVAEDEETLRELARTVLVNLGYRVLLAKNGEEAVTAFEDFEGRIDLLMLDLIMPRMSGREAYHRIHEMGKDVPVIFMTGYASRTLQTNVLDEGSVLIQKPYAVDELGRIVRDVLDAHAAEKTRI